jgi:predicted transglutaminase-like protease
MRLAIGLIENGTKKAKIIVANKSLNTRANTNHGKYYEDIARKQLESQLRKTNSNIK